MLVKMRQKLRTLLLASETYQLEQLFDDLENNLFRSSLIAAALVEVLIDPDQGLSLYVEAYSLFMD